MPPTQENISSPAPMPVGTPPAFRRLPTKTLITVGVAIVLIGAAILYFWPPQTSPAAQSMTSAAKTIGLANFRQGETAVEGLKKGLSDLGYTNVQYVGDEVSVSDPNFMQVIQDQYTKEIQNDHVDLLFADHEQQAVAALAATKALGVDTPIVYLARFHDPVQLGLAASYKSSGNNATGVAQNLVDTTSRNLEFIKQISPKAHKLGVFGQGFVIPGVGDQYLAEFKSQAEKQGFQVVEYTTDAQPQDTEKAFDSIAATIKPGDIDALIHVPGHFYDTQEAAELQLAERLHIPHSVPVEDLWDGGQFAYAADFRNAGEQAAKIVDKIFRGAKPSDIPVEYGEKSLLILNDARAKVSGFSFPDSMRFLADEILTSTSSAPTAQ